MEIEKTLGQILAESQKHHGCVSLTGPRNERIATDVAKVVLQRLSDRAREIARTEGHNEFEPYTLEEAFLKAFKEMSEELLYKY